MSDKFQQLADTADFLALYATFEAARDDEASAALSNLCDELKSLSASGPRRANAGENCAGDNPWRKRDKIERRLAAIRQNQCEISGLADRIAATARRLTGALYFEDVVDRVVVYSRGPADRLRSMVTGIESRYLDLEAALAADRDRARSLERSLAVDSAVDDVKIQRALTVVGAGSLDRGGGEMV